MGRRDEALIPVHILVTGGAGFIGSFIVDRLVKDGYRVRILDSLDSQVHGTGRPDYLNSHAELIVADVRNPDAVRSAIDDVDVVVHAAAAVGVAQSTYEVQRYVASNVGGMANVLQALIDRGRPLKKLIVFASMTEYAEGVYERRSDGVQLRVGIRSEQQIEDVGWEPVCPQTGEVLVPVATPEDAALMASNIYALTKRSQEELALSVGQAFGFPVVCFRLFNVYGPRQSLSNPYTGVLSIFLSRLMSGQRPVVYEDGHQTRDFISVHDVAQAVILALGSEAADGQVVNLGSGTARSIGDVAETLARLLGKREIQPQVTKQFRKGDVRHCIADMTRARKLLGFAPSVNWDESLSELIAWARSATAVDRYARAHHELTKHRLLSNPLGGET